MDKGFARPNWDEYFMLQAELVKLRSNCLTRKIGAIIVKGRIQIAAGYNGTPPGIKNCFEGGCRRCLDRMRGNISSGQSLERCLCSHAESNAMMHCAALGISTAGRDVTLYTTLAPCMECTKMAITVGIRRIVCYDGSYPDTDRRLLKESGIQVDTINRDAAVSWLDGLLRPQGDA